MDNIAGIPQQKMKSAPDPGADGSGLWSFSLGFYDQPGAADALMALQDEAGLNVDLVLFAIWLGLSGRGRLGAQQLDQAERAVRSVQSELIEPLRALRRRLKTVPDPEIQALRERLKLVEIDAEKVALTRLGTIAAAVSKTDPDDCLADAEANLLDYLDRERAASPPVAIIRRQLRHLAANR